MCTCALGWSYARSRCGRRRQDTLGRLPGGWRVTAPIRNLGRLARFFKRPG